VNEERLHQFVGKGISDMAAIVNGAMVVLGDRLGLYRAMAGAGPVTAAELAARTGSAERYLREWLCAQAASGYVEHHAGERFSLPEEHAIALIDEASPACLVGGFQAALAAVHSTGKIGEAFLSGAGVGWGEHHQDLYEGTERFFGPTYRNQLVASWLPALDGVVDKLRRGATVADVGCGRGASTLVMGAAFPQATFVGFDVHEPSITGAQARASAAGLDDRVHFAAATATSFPGRYDLVAFFDCLHDMGDPVGACAHVLDALHDDGTLMVVEPRAGDRTEDNLNPVGAAYYAFSTLLCTPNALAQDGGVALGAQAGPARMSQVIAEAGFRTVRQVAETPFNYVLEARP
jgi:SAM-dependent methyltransferase